MTSEMKPALDEISAIYKKYGLCGAFTITNGTTLDYKMVLESPWSCAHEQWEGDELVAVRLRCKPSEIPDIKDRAKLIHATLAMLAGIRQANASTNEKCDALMRMAAQYVNVTTRIDDIDDDRDPPWEGRLKA